MGRLPERLVHWPVATTQYRMWNSMRHRPIHVPFGHIERVAATTEIGFFFCSATRNKKVNISG